MENPSLLSREPGVRSMRRYGLLLRFPAIDTLTRAFLDCPKPTREPHDFLTRSKDLESTKPERQLLDAPGWVMSKIIYTYADIGASDTKC